MADTYFNICFLKKFNNYFNRKVIGFKTLAEYINAAEDFFIPDHTISFDPKDNVSTEIIMNDCPFDADYCLVLDLENNILTRWFVMEVVFIRKGQKTYKLRRDVIYDNLEELIMSPVFVQKGWLKNNDPFILNPEGMSFNEIKSEELLLKDSTLSAWIVGYIAKNAAPTDISIQTAQETISEYVNLSTIASDMGVTEQQLAKVLNFGTDRNNIAYFSTEFTITYAGSTNDTIPFISKFDTSFNEDFSESVGSESDWVSSWNKTLFKTKFSYFAGSPEINFADLNNDLIFAITTQYTSIVPDLESIFQRPYFKESQLNILLRYLGKTIQYNGSFYKLSISDSGTDTTKVGPATYSSFFALGGIIDDLKNDFDFANYTTWHNDGEITLTQKSKKIYISLIDSQPETTIPALKTKISSSRAVVRDQNYDMFCIPLNKVFIDEINYNNYTKEDIALKVAAEIAKELDTACYDIQLLPYCPRTDAMILQPYGTGIDLTNLTEGEDYDYIKVENSAIETQITIFVSIDSDIPVDADGFYTYVGSVQNQDWPSNLSDIISMTYTGSTVTDGTVKDATFTYNAGLQAIGVTVKLNKQILEAEAFGVDLSFKYTGTENQSIILWCKSVSFSTKLNYSLSLKDSIKIESQCNKYRLCSPNYQGLFEFNVAKNGGFVDYFLAECTYKPYTPYIKVAPQFNWLYGTNYGDARGLICGGDFSLARFSSAWENYELNNKNYQNIFNRDIQHLDFEHSLEYRKALITGGIGILTGGVGGAAAGGMASGSWIGAVVGGVAGTAGSAAGLGLDIDLMVRQQRETKQYAIDKFNYQLGNIKALPYTLTKVGAFNVNSKIWPFVEYYTCTDKEKEALQNKLKYESMTVMRIANFGDFWRVDSELRYFKGELIRNEEIAEDNHIFEAIYGEILKGVYM